MAQIDFYQTDKENYETVEFLIDNYKARFVPENNHKKEYVELTSLQEIKTHIQNYKYSPRYFVLSNEWTLHSLYQRELVKNGNFLYYYVMQRHGGPAFDFIFSRTFIQDGKEWIVSGSISDYPYYYEDSGVEKTFNRPESMKKAYTAISQFLRKDSMKSICEEGGFSGPLIRRDALLKYQAGTWLRAGDFHFIPNSN